MARGKADHRLAGLLDLQVGIHLRGLRPLTFQSLSLHAESTRYCYAQLIARPGTLP